SVGVSWGQVAMNMIRQQWVPPKEMATVMGAILSGNTIVQSGGLLLVPVLLVTFGSWRPIYGFGSIVLFTIAIVWFLTARERISPSYETARNADRGLKSAKVVLRRREFYLLGLAGGGGATAFLTFLLFLPSYYIEERDFTLQTAGAITAVIPLGGLVVNLLAGYVSDRIGRRKPLIWPSGIMLPGLWLLMLMPLSPPVLMAIAIPLGAFVFMPFPVLQSIPFEIEGLSPADRAVGQALQFSIVTVGALLGPLVVGMVVGATGSYFTGLLPLIALPTFFIWATLFLPETGTAAKTDSPSA
ncbi:MAG: MFS transporter, partial [Dehalococcoidia bacterium]